MPQREKTAALTGGIPGPEQQDLVQEWPQGSSPSRDLRPTWPRPEDSEPWGLLAPVAGDISTGQ